MKKQLVRIFMNIVILVAGYLMGHRTSEAHAQQARQVRTIPKSYGHCVAAYIVRDTGAFMMVFEDSNGAITLFDVANNVGITYTRN